MRFFLLLAVFVCKGIFAQPVNIIPNPSFEIYDTCPYKEGVPNYSGTDQICFARPWFQPSFPNPLIESGCGGSSDFFHYCADAIPGNVAGFQNPNTGLGYAGIGLYYFQSNDGREYIEIQLNSKLENRKYCTSFFVSLADKYNWIATNCIQTRFTDDTVFQLDGWMKLNLNEGINNLNIISDTTDWTLLKGIYNAKGGENFMTVGCFDDFQIVNDNCINPSNCGYAYYYFDDFGVYELPEISAGLGGEIDTLGENVGLQANCEGCWNDLVFRWWPSAGLSDTTILNPIATPEVTTTYYFGLIDTSETVPCIVDLVDSVTVFVTIPQDTVTPPPTSFSWLVYPSPTSGNLTLQFSALNNDSQLLIIDARGRLVRKIVVPKNTESLPLDISALAAGEYFLQVENEGLKEKRKVTKI
jgi:hypothetical protein